MIKVWKVKTANKEREIAKICKFKIKIRTLLKFQRENSAESR
jgi:hypothetical protein